MKYESNILERLIKTYGVVGNPKYVSEIIKQFIIQGKECYPNLFTYQSDWLAHIDEFGLANDYVVTYTGQSIYAPNTLEKPIKSAILKCQTLVNMCDDGVADASDITRFTHNYTGGGGTFEQVTDGVKATATQDGTFLIVGYDIRSQQKKMMTIGKKYYGVADVTIHKLTNSDSCKVIFRVMYGLRESKSLTDGRGLVQSVFTHGSDDANLGWLAVGTNGQKAVVGDSFTVHSMSVYEITEEETNLSYEELANKYPVKCVGMTSCKMPVLTTTGKNLFDGKLELGELNTQNGTIDNVLNYDRRHRSVNYISVKSNTNYTYSCNIGDSGCNWIWYDKDKKYIKTSSYRITATSPSNAKYLKYFSGMPQGTNLSTLKVQIEESSTTTPFEPHKTNILSCLEPVELGSVGEVKDELNLLTQQLTQRTETRAYQEGDELNSEFVTDMTNTRYKLAQEVVKTVDLTIKDQNDVEVSQLRSFNGGTHFSTSSQEGSLKPMIEVDVVTDLEETLMVCSLEGNTM